MVVRTPQNKRVWGRTVMRATYAMMVLLGLAACQAPVPNSGPGGVGFQDYNSYLRDRAAPTNSAAATTPDQPSAGFSTDAATAAIDASQAPGATGAPLNPTGQATGQATGQIIGQTTGQLTAGQTTTGTAPTGTAPLPPIDTAACAGRGNAFAGIQQTTAEMNFVHGGVSDEQDFSAVKGRETIASDKQRIECNREQYVVVQPGALPVRPGDEGPNIAAFALATTNPPGVKLYGRPPFYLVNVAAACGKFASPDLAQQAFLAAGGPQRDSKGLDPDGDGFACTWDPRPFRNAKK